MMKYKALILIVSLCSQVCQSGMDTTRLNTKEKELQNVVVIYRHGDRTPIKPYKTDPYQDAIHWEAGFGQLTARGKNSSYHLGKYLRERYGGFLSEFYSPKELLVHSTDYDRTIMTAQCVSAGLFPPINQVWDGNLNWQPIPIHTTPVEMDQLLGMAPCPRHVELVEELKQSEAFKKLNSSFNDLLAYVNHHTQSEIYNFCSLLGIYDTLFVQHQHGMKLPRWAEYVFPEKLKVPADLSFKVGASTPQMARLIIGTLVDTIVQNFKNSTLGNISSSPSSVIPPKMLMFSAHDSTIARLMDSLGLFEPPKFPPYNTMVMFELYKKKSRHNFHIELLYKEPEKSPILMKLQNCSQKCPFEKFEEITKPIRPLNLGKECEAKNIPAESGNYSTSFKVLSSLLVTVLILYGIVQYVEGVGRNLMGARLRPYWD